MKYIYCYKIEWSQTEHDTIFIISTANDIANMLKTWYPNARYFHLIAKSQLDSVIE